MLMAWARMSQPGIDRHGSRIHRLSELTTGHIAAQACCCVSKHCRCHTPLDHATLPTQSHMQDDVDTQIAGCCCLHPRASRKLTACPSTAPSPDGQLPLAGTRLVVECAESCQGVVHVDSLVGSHLQQRSVCSTAEGSASSRREQRQLWQARVRRERERVCMVMHQLSKPIVPQQQQGLKRDSGARGQ